jgi:hypothetical protein
MIDTSSSCTRTRVQDTVTFGAGEECARMQSEDLEVKARAAFCKPVQKNKNIEKLQDESPLHREKKTVPAMKKRLLYP